MSGAFEDIMRQGGGSFFRTEFVEIILWWVLKGYRPWGGLRAGYESIFVLKEVAAGRIMATADLKWDGSQLFISGWSGLTVPTTGPL